MPVDLLYLGDRFEMIACAHGFRHSEKQDAAIAQSKMKQRKNFLLSLRAQVDEKVTTSDEIEA